MTTSSELYVIRILALGILLILPATSGAQQRTPLGGREIGYFFDPHSGRWCGIFAARSC